MNFLFTHKINGYIVLIRSELTVKTFMAENTLYEGIIMSRHDSSIFFYDWKYFLIVSKLAQIH